MFLFSHTFPVLSEYTFPMFWDNTTDVKTNNNKKGSPILIPLKQLFETHESWPILLLSPNQYLHFRTFFHGSMEVYGGI